MIISQSGIVDIIPEYNRALRPIFCVSEGDADSRMINITIQNAGNNFNIPEGANVYVAGKKLDGTIFTYECSFSGYIVSFPILEQMSAVSGLVLCEIQIVVAGDPLGSANFCFWVEPSPIENGTTSESDLNIFVQAISDLGGYEFLTDEVAVLSARMDQFARLPDGSLSTAADAELADVRVMANGTTAATAGEAVRRQVDDLKSALGELATVTASDGKFSSAVESGAINGGNEAASTSRARTVDYLPIFGGKVILTLSSGYSAHIVGYDGNKEYVSDFGSWNTDGATITATGCSYIRLVFKNSAGTELTDSDITTLSGFYITETPARLEELKAHDNVDDLKGKAQIYIIRPNRAYIEQTYTAGGSVYFHFDGNIAVREIANVTKSISALATDIGTTLVTSPNGVENCIEIADTTCLVFNTDTNTFEMVTRTSISNEMIVVINCAGGKVINSLDSFTFDGIYNLSSEINNLSAELGNSYIADSVDSVVNNMANQNGNCLNLAFITDLHFNAFGDDVSEQTEIWRRNSSGLSAVSKKRNIDFTILGGDYLWNNTNLSTLARVNKAYSELQKVFYPHGDRLYALKGNHDDNSITNDVSKIISDDIRYGYLGQQYTNDVVINYGDAQKSYGYIDFNRQKVRIIFINTVDIPYDDTLTYKGQTVKAIGNNQLNFIADSLKFTDSGWGVIFFSHHALVNNSGINPANNPDVFVTSEHGGDAIWGIIQAFKNKSSFAVTSTLADFEYSVSVDYTSNASDDVIACINGHTHEDLSGVQNGILLITTTASGYGVSAYDSNGTLISRTVGTSTETSFDIFSIDRINGTINASRYGAGQNRNWSY